MMASRLVSSGSSLPMMVSRSDEYCDSPAAREDEGAQPPTARVPAAKEGGREEADRSARSSSPGGRGGGPNLGGDGRRKRRLARVDLGGAGAAASVWEARCDARRRATGSGELPMRTAFFCASGGQTHASVDRISCSLGSRTVGDRRFYIHN